MPAGEGAALQGPSLQKRVGARRRGGTGGYKRELHEGLASSLYESPSGITCYVMTADHETGVGFMVLM